MCFCQNLSAQALYPGNVDPDFDPGTGFEVAVNLFQGMRVQTLPDGKVYVGGDFIAYDDDTDQGSFIRLNPDGSADAAFNTNNSVSGIVRDIAVRETDGKVILAGITNLSPGNPSGGMAVINADGTLDENFETQGGFTGGNVTVTSVAVQGDQILVGGRFTQYRGQNRKFLTRIEADGTPDPDFNQIFNTYADGVIRQIVVLPDNSFIAVGPIGDSFESVGKIWYCNPDGSLNTDKTAVLESLNGAIIHIELMENGQLMILGGFTSFQGQPAQRLVRLNADLSMDTGFTSGLINPVQGSEFLGLILARCAVQDDGKVIVVGYFTEVDGTVYNGIVRFNNDGSIDQEWDSGAGFNYPATDAAMANDGKIYVAGRFWQYDNIPRSGIVRIVAESTLSLDQAASSPFKIYPNPASDVLFIESDMAVREMQIYDLTGRMVYAAAGLSSGLLSLDLAALNPGVYLARIAGAEDQRTVRFVVTR